MTTLQLVKKKVDYVTKYNGNIEVITFCTLYIYKLPHLPFRLDYLLLIS